MATKKTKLNNHSSEDLAQLIAKKREELRTLRFSSAGSKNKNVKQARTIRKEIARALTETSARKHAAAA